MTASAGLEEKLQARLNDALGNKESQLAHIAQLQLVLNKLMSKNVKRPRGSTSELDDEIKALERKRTTTSVTLAQERQILKEINSIEKSKLQVSEYQKYDEEIKRTKAELSDCRDNLTRTILGITELEEALSKVKLANKIGCSTQDLNTVVIECPKEKLGKVIGKNGANIKQLMASTSAIIDVRKDSNEIEITGDSAAIAAAKAEIGKIALATEDSITDCQDLVTYLTTRSVDVVQKLRDEYPNVYLDVVRNTDQIAIRGIPEDIASVTKFLKDLGVEKKQRSLTKQEALAIVGRKGSTVDRLVNEHKVAIDVVEIDSDEPMVYVIGPVIQVDEALATIDTLLSDNHEIVFRITLTATHKRILLSDAGMHIKALQAKVNEQIEAENPNVYLSFDKEEIDKERPELLIKAKRVVLDEAIEYTEAGLKETSQLITTISVDPFVIPRIIGKGGEQIKELKKGRSAFIEVERSPPEVILGAIDAETLEAVREDLNKLLAENQVIRIDGNPQLMAGQYREFMRSKTRNEIAELAWFDKDDEKNQFILRGEAEKVSQAKEMLLNFLLNTFIDEISVSQDDFDVLLSGGKESKIVSLSEELDVNLSADKNNGTIVIRGPQDKVGTAAQKLRQFLYGGDGHCVATISVTDQVVGLVIGKGGKTRVAFEESHPGVSINVSKKSNQVSIRGPEKAVSECKVEILKKVASARVSQSIAVTEEQLQTLEKKNTIKRTMKAIPVNITSSETEIVVRGFFFDTSDAVSLLNEALTGVYSSNIDLESAQYAKVSNAARDPSHFSRIGEESGADIFLDAISRSIVISGKRNNVKKAKDLVFGFLDFLLPQEIHKFKLSKPLHSSVGKASNLAEISATTGGTTIYLDRDISSIVALSSDVTNVKTASTMILSLIKEGEKLAYVLQLDPSEAWIIPMVIGKGGQQVTNLQNEAGCKVDIDREARTITVTGDSEEGVAKAKTVLDTLVDKCRRQCVFVDIPEASLPSFVGKGGSKIKAFATEHGVEIQRGRKGGQFKITGEENPVAAAVSAIDEWVKEWKEANGSVEMGVEKNQIPILLGGKGAFLQSVQEEFKCRVDIDRSALRVRILNGKEEDRLGALKKIEAMLAESVLAAEEAKKKAAAATEPEEPIAPPTKTQDKPKPSSNGSTGVIDHEERKNRTAEFPTMPVGQSNGTRAKPGPTRNILSNSQKVIQKPGTETGRGLFQLLVSD